MSVYILFLVVVPALHTEKLSHKMRNDRMLQFTTCLSLSMNLFLCTCFLRRFYCENTPYGLLHTSTLREPDRLYVCVLYS